MDINILEANVKNNSASSLVAISHKGVLKGANENIVNTNRENRDFFSLSKKDSSNTGIYSPNVLASNISAKATGTTTAKVIKNIPYSLAAKRAGLSVDSTGMPRINGSADAKSYNVELNKIRNVSRKLTCKSEYRYSQTGNDYGYNNAKSSCATYALATAISMRDGKIITPKDIVTNSSTDGHGTSWSSHGAYKVDCDEQQAFLAIDAQLSLGNPVLIHTDGKSSSGNPSEHWATVIGKQNGEYTIIDPWDGKEHPLSEMQIYKNGGSVIGYAVVSNKY